MFHHFSQCGTLTIVPWCPLFIDGQSCNCKCSQKRAHQRTRPRVSELRGWGMWGKVGKLLLLISVLLSALPQLHNSYEVHSQSMHWTTGQSLHTQYPQLLGQVHQLRATLTTLHYHPTLLSLFQRLNTQDWDCPEWQPADDAISNVCGQAWDCQRQPNRYINSIERHPARLHCFYLCCIHNLGRQFPALVTSNRLHVLRYCTFCNTSQGWPGSFSIILVGSCTIIEAWRKYARFKDHHCNFCMMGLAIQMLLSFLAWHSSSFPMCRSDNYHCNIHNTNDDSGL